MSYSWIQRSRDYDELTVPVNGYVLTYNATTEQWAPAAAAAGGVTDGVKGDITVSGSGTVWTVTSLVIENRTSDPSSPATGRIWLRTDL